MKKWYLSVAALIFLGLGMTLEAEAVSTYGWDGSVSYRDSDGISLEEEMVYTNPATVQVIFVDEKGEKLPFDNADMVKVVGNVGDWYDLNGPQYLATDYFGSGNTGWYDAIREEITEGNTGEAFGFIPEGGKIIYKRFKLRNNSAVAEPGDYGWKQIDGRWYYQGKNHDQKLGWLAINNQWYYLGEEYYGEGMHIGWSIIDGFWYYFNASGVMQTGWQLIDGTWYYFSPSGSMVTGWKVINDSWYYFNGSGAMLSGWQAIGGTWYYFNGSGAMTTGWQQIHGSWYYFSGSGAMQTGWLKLGNDWYYLNFSGVMQTGNLKINGISYRFSNSGIMQ